MNSEEVKKAIVELDVDAVKNLVNKMLAAKSKPEDILEKGLIAGMQEVGRLFSCKEYFVPEVLIASDAFYAGFEIIKPLIKKTQSLTKGKIVIGVVEGDIHDIGKNIVKVMLDASGYEVVDLGKDVPTKRFIDTVTEEKPQILAISSLMTTTMVQMKEIIKLMENKGLRKDVKVIVGGAPVNQEFAQLIKADGYAEDAAQAVKVVETLVNPPLVPLWKRGK